MSFIYMVACKGSLALHSFRVSVSDSEFYIYIHTQRRGSQTSFTGGSVQKVSFLLSATAVCVCVKIESECSNNVEVI